jgi:H+/Cl- antiporter ClcA
MASINAGVTKTPLGSTIVVSEMAGLLLLPTTLIATVVALLLTSGHGVIASQRQRSGSLDEGAAADHDPPASLSQAAGEDRGVAHDPAR